MGAGSSRVPDRGIYHYKTMCIKRRDKKAFYHFMSKTLPCPGRRPLHANLQNCRGWGLSFLFCSVVIKGVSFFPKQN